MLHILGREVSDPENYREFYKAVVQATILFREESWVMYPRIGRTLDGFHHRLDPRMANMNPKRYVTGRWIYPPLQASMKELGLEEVDAYVLCLQNTVTQYITTWLILEICIVVDQQPGPRVLMIWWYQAGIYLG